MYLLTGNFDGAERAFQSALANASRIGDQFFQTQAFVNLGVVSLHEEHYEDALVRLGNASTLARSIGARLLLEKAVGNIGWIYYKTGDFQRSLINCKEAQRQAAELGSQIDQVHWLDNAGLSEYQLGDVEAARRFYESSLALARSIQNEELILDAEVDLGFLLLRLGDLSAAEIQVREAERSAALIKSDRAALEPMLLHALLLEARGDKQSALKQLLDLNERAEQVPSLKWQTESNLARVYSEVGQPIDADHWFERSINTFQHQRSSLTSVESSLPFLENGSDLYLNYMKHLIDEQRPEEALNIIDESRAESLADGLHLSSADAAHVSWTKSL
jgi:tetratricopeptide (TPR) repeat protein